VTTVTGSVTIGGVVYNPSASVTLPASGVPKLSALTDSFASFDSTKWTQSKPADVSYSGGYVNITADLTGYPNIKAVQQYDLTESSTFLHFAPPSGGTGVTAELVLDSPTAGTSLRWTYSASAGTVTAGLYVNYTATTVQAAAYNASAHAWLKISESGGTVTFWTSADGISWASFYTLATPSWAATVTPVLSAEATGASSTSPAKFGSLSITPAASGNVTVDFTASVKAVDPLGVGITLSTYGGTTSNIKNTAWRAALQALAPGHCRIPLRWNGGNPGSSAGGGQTSGDADAYIGYIKGIGALPFVVYGGDASDNGGINASDAAAFVHHYNDNGGQNNGPVKYWVCGNEPDVSGGTGPYESVVGSIVAAMHGADATVKVSAPAAGWWDTALIGNASVLNSGLDILSYHAYDGGNTDGTGFPTDPQYGTHVGTDLPAYKGGIMYGVEEVNWNPAAGASQFLDWHNTCFLADAAGQVLKAGGHFTQYADSNGALGLMSDGSGGLPAQGTKLPAYWGLGIWTGMNGQFKRWGAHMVAASTTFAFGTLAVYACDNGKIVVVNKGASAQALTIAMTGKTSGTYNVWATNSASPDSPVTEAVSGAAYSGGLISYTVPAQTAASIDVS